MSRIFFLIKNENWIIHALVKLRERFYPHLTQKKQTEQRFILNCFINSYNFEFSPISQEVAGSIPAQYKHLRALTCLFVLGLGVFYV
jgi:hypothetical protein